jgi:hypothetical protein
MTRRGREPELGTEPVSYWPKFFSGAAAAEVSRAEREAEAELEMEI